MEVNGPTSVFQYIVVLGESDVNAQTGEIDIIEGVHDNAHNQVTWHTGPGRFLDPADV